jgi:hypothetical protein
MRKHAHIQKHISYRQKGILGDTSISAIQREIFCRAISALGKTCSDFLMDGKTATPCCAVFAWNIFSIALSYHNINSALTKTPVAKALANSIPQSFHSTTPSVGALMIRDRAVINTNGTKRRKTTSRKKKSAPKAD